MFEVRRRIRQCGVCGSKLLFSLPSLTAIDCHQIRLTQSDIPFETQVLATSQPFADVRVIQDFKQTHCYIPQFANPGFLVPDGSFPLVMVRLTTLEHSQTSVIGISWHHILGDAQVCSRYLKQLSTVYDALVRGTEPRDFSEYPDCN